VPSCGVGARWPLLIGNHRQWPPRMPDRTLQRRGPPPPPLRCSAAEPSGSAPPSASAPFKSWLKLLTEKPTQFYALVFGSLALCTAAMKLAISKFSQEGVSGLAGFTLRERVVYVLESGVKSPDVWLWLCGVSIGVLLVGAVVTTLWLRKPFVESVWWSWGLMADPGTGAMATKRNDRILSFFLTLAGMLLFGTAIGLVADTFSNRFTELGNESRVVEKGHTVVIGWDSSTIPLLQELDCAARLRAEASPLRFRRPVLVVLGNEDKQEMESTIQRYLPYKDRFSKIVVRSGSGTSYDDLNRVSVGEASRVAVLAQKNGASADLADCYGVYVTTAIRQFGHFEGKILVEVTEEENVAISHRVMQILDRLFAKGRQGGLTGLTEGTEKAGLVHYSLPWTTRYQNDPNQARLVDLVLYAVREDHDRSLSRALLEVGLLDLDREIGSFFSAANVSKKAEGWMSKLHGLTFHKIQAVIAKEGSLIAIKKADSNRIIINPRVEDGVKYENGDNLIVLSRNRSSMRPPWRPHAASFDALKPQQVLVCGMKELPFMHDLCQELSHQLAPGSEVTIFAHGASALSPTLKRIKSNKVKFQAVDGIPWCKEHLTALPLHKYSSALLLKPSQEHSQSYDEVADSQDVRNVATATLLRSEHPDGQRLRIIAELTSIEARESSENLLDDSCVREQRLSRGLAQAMEDSDAAHVLSCLQRSGRRGSQAAMYTVRSTDVAPAGSSVSFADIQASLRQKNTLAVGYRTAEGSWILNPLDIHKPLQWSDNIYLAVIEGTSCLNEPTTI